MRIDPRACERRTPATTATRRSSFYARRREKILCAHLQARLLNEEDAPLSIKSGVCYQLEKEKKKKKRKQDEEEIERENNGAENC